MSVWIIVCLILTAITSYIGWCFIVFAIVATIIDYVKRKKQEGNGKKE